MGARALATRSMGGLARSRVTPNALTASGVLLCAVASVLVYFEYRNEILFFWVGAVVFVVGSLLDILDGALARLSGKGTPFGAFLDSTTDRVSEGFMLGSIALVFHRDDNQVALAFAFAAVAGLVPRLLHARAGRGARPQGRRRHRFTRRARRRDHVRSRAGAVGRLALGDLPACRDGLVHRGPAGLVGAGPVASPRLGVYC